VPCGDGRSRVADRATVHGNAVRRAVGFADTSDAQTTVQGTTNSSLFFFIFRSVKTHILLTILSITFSCRSKSRAIYSPVGHFLLPNSPSTSCRCAVCHLSYYPFHFLLQFAKIVFFPRFFVSLHFKDLFSLLGRALCPRFTPVLCVLHYIYA